MSPKETSPMVILDALWNRRWLIVAGAVACALVAGAVSWNLPDVYQASATLVVVPPSYRTEISGTTYTMETYVELARAPFIIQGVVDELQLTDSYGAPLPVESLQRRLGIDTIEIDQLRGRSLSPVLTLTATAERAEDAREIASAWARVFRERVSTLRVGQTTDIGKTVSEQFSLTRETLENMELDYELFQQAAHIELRELHIEVERKRLVDAWAHLRDISIDIERDDETLTRLEAQLEAMELDGSWIGGFGPGFDDRVQRAAAANPNEFTAEVLESRRELLAAGAALREFQAATDLSVQRNEINLTLEKLTEFKVELLTMRNRSTTVALVLERLEAEQARQPSAISLAKSVSEDAFWLAAASDDALTGGLPQIEMRSEVVNPVYEELTQKVIDYRVERDTLKPKVEHYDGLVELLETELAVLQARLKEDEEREQFLSGRLERARQMHDDLAGKYASRKEEALKLRLDLDLRRNMKQHTQELVSDLDTEVTGMRRELIEKHNEDRRRVRELAALRASYETLSARYEEARIAALENESEVSIAAPPILPRRPVGPQRAANVVVATLLGIVLSSLMVVAFELLADARTPARPVPAKRVVESIG